MTDDYSKMNVKSLIEIYENKNNEDYMVGWTEGLNRINQSKYYVSLNGILFEKTVKIKLKYNHGYLKCSMIIYYLCQENDFFDWYRDRKTKYYNTEF